MGILTKNNIKNLVIILLLITNITTITTILVHGHRHHERMRENSFTENPNHRHNTPNKRFDPFMQSELGLSAEQKDDFVIFRNDFMKQSRQIMDGMKDYRIQINEELKKENPDMEILNSAADEIGRKHKQLKILSFEMLFKMKKVCTAEQQDKLVEIFIDMQPKPFCKPNQKKKDKKNRN